jgi:hypothetical protein
MHTLRGLWPRSFLSHLRVFPAHAGMNRSNHDRHQLELREFFGGSGGQQRLVDNYSAGLAIIIVSRS